MLCEEELACKLREDKSIKGIKKVDRELKHKSQYADDISSPRRRPKKKNPTKSYSQHWMDLREYQD